MEHRTPMQLYLEEKYRLPIEVLIRGPLSQVAERFQIDKSTVSKWRKKLGLVPPSYCEKHSKRFDDFCGECWLETVDKIVGER